MPVSVPNHDFTFQGDQIKFYRDQAEQVVRDSNEAGRCVRLKTMIASMVFMYDWVLDNDIKVRSAFATGQRPHDPEYFKEHAEFLGEWCSFARVLEERAKVFEDRDYEVEGANKLRDRIREVSAILNPSDAVNSEAEALSEHRQGKTTLFPIDLDELREADAQLERAGWRGIPADEVLRRAKAAIHAD